MWSDLKVTEDLAAAWKAAELPASDVDLDQFLQAEGLHGGGGGGQARQYKAPGKRNGGGGGKGGRDGKRRRYHGSMNLHLLGSIIEDKR